MRRILGEPLKHPLSAKLQVLEKVMAYLSLQRSQRPPPAFAQEMQPSEPQTTGAFSLSGILFLGSRFERVGFSW